MTTEGLYRFTFWARVEEITQLRGFLEARGPGLEISAFCRCLIDAMVDFVLASDRLTSQQEEEANRCGEEFEEEELGGAKGSERITISIRLDQMVRVAELAKALEISQGGALRLIWKLWDRGLLDPWLSRSFRRHPEPIEPELKLRLMEKVPLAKESLGLRR